MGGAAAPIRIENRRFPLIGNADDGRDPLRFAEALQYPAAGGHDRCPDHFGIVFHPARGTG